MRICLSLQKTVVNSSISSACASCQSRYTPDVRNKTYRKTAVMTKLIIMCDCNCILLRMIPTSANEVDEEPFNNGIEQDFTMLTLLVVP